MTLRGPAHPDTFRTQVGRYGDRFYVDPLPACDLADATDDHWPSVSIVKGAWPKNLGPWMAAEAARFAVEHRDTWVNLPADAAVDMIAKSSDRTRNAAADRGTEVHRLLENIAAGQEPDEVWVPDAVPYLPVLRQLVADLGLTPESFVMTEAVCISRTLGYGGTADAVIRVDAGDMRGAFSVDWKTRKPGRHDAYRDECAQLAAYTFADYIIVEENGQAVRAVPPKVDGGMIVSITPDDYRLYPVDLDAAWRTFTELRGFWDTTKRTVRGKHVVVPRRPLNTTTDVAASVPVDPFDGLTPMADAEAARAADPSPSVAPVTPAPDTESAATPGVGGTASPERWAWARQRLITITEVAPQAPIVWPDGIVTFREARESGYRHTDDEIDTIVAALVDVEAKLRLPFPDPDPGRSDIEPEPEPVAVAPRSPKVLPSDPRVAELGRRAMALPPDLLARLEAEAVTARGIPNLSSGHATEEQLATVEMLLGPLEALHADRLSNRQVALSLCQANGCEPITALNLVAPGRDADRLTEWEIESLDNLAVALASAAVVKVDDGKIVATDSAEAALVEIHGGRREVLAAARQIISAREWDASPKSASDVAADPVLAAAVEVSDRAADVA